jgi:hypothetical protein
MTLVLDCLKECITDTLCRVCSILKSWADKHYYDFQKEPQLVEKFVSFLESLKDRGMEKVAGIIVRALYKKVEFKKLNDLNYF